MVSSQNDDGARSEHEVGKIETSQPLSKYKQVFWIHQASFLYRSDAPDRFIETIWTEHPGWGYLRRRDLWIQVECSSDDLRARGFVEMRPLSDDNVRVCPHCGMYINSIPGFLAQRHMTECGGPGEDWLKFEEAQISEKRFQYYEAQILAAKLREKAEQEAEEKKERFDKIREENLARQQQRDRKKRLKEETKKEWRQRWKNK